MTSKGDRQGSAPQPADNTEPSRDSGDPAGRGFSLIASFVGFLDKRFSSFPRWLQNTIGLTFLVLLAVISLHAFVAPTVVQGRLFTVDEEGGAKSFARFTKLSTGDRDIVTDESGRWVLQVRGFLPRRVRVTVHQAAAEEAGDEYLADFTLWEPWPVRSALAIADYQVVVHRWRGDDGRVELAREERPGVYRLLAGWFDHLEVARAGGLSPRVVVRMGRIGEVACDDGHWCGTRGERRYLEGLSLRLPPTLDHLSIEYRCRRQRGGDSGWLADGRFCQADGGLDGFAARLSGAGAGDWSIVYQAHFQYHAESRAFRDGEFVRGDGRSGALEAVRVWLEPR